MHCQVPFCVVPEKGVVLEHDRLWNSELPSVHCREQATEETPAGASVSPTVQVTFCAALVVLTLVGLSENDVTTGGEVSHCAAAGSAVAASASWAKAQINVARRSNRTDMAFSPRRPREKTNFTGLPYYIIRLPLFRKKS